VVYNLAFCPERTLEGRALEELRTLPQIIGGVDEASALRAARLFQFLTPTIVRVANAETAELIKLVNNTQRDLVFAFANEMATVADALGVSITEVVHGGGLGYPRGQIPMPGPVGGPCLEKDPYILAESVEPHGIAPALTLQGRLLNEQLPARVAANLALLFDGRPVRRVTVLGLAFKGRPETSDLRGTVAIPLIAELRSQFPAATLTGFDPVVPPADIAALGIEVSPSLEAAFDAADLVVIQNNHPAFGTMDIDTLADRLAPDAVVYDLWNQHDASRLTLREDVTYAGLGARRLRAPVVARAPGPAGGPALGPDLLPSPPQPVAVAAE
jgi:nucleotide sugar dehydrogenase